MYTIQTLTHIVATDKLQALIKFTHNGKEAFTTALLAVSNVGSNLSDIYDNENFINGVNEAIAAQKELIDKPLVP